MSIKRLILLFLTVLGFEDSQAQQGIMSTMGFLDFSAWNPAAAGFDGTLKASILYRSQWQQLEGAPEYQMANLQSPLDMFNGGVGLQLYRQVSGPLTKLDGSLNLMYAPIKNEKYHWSIGTGIRAGQIQILGDQLRTPGGTYGQNLVNHNDRILPTGKLGGSFVSFRVGTQFSVEDITIGLYGDGLNNPLANLPDGFGFRVNRELGGYVRYQMELTKDISLNNAIMVQNDKNRTQAQMSILASYKEGFDLGVGARGYSSSTFDAIQLMTGFRWSPSTKIFYSYDLSLSKLNSVNNGTHELWLVWDLGKSLFTGKKQGILFNPRYQ
jgi:type IX secretion system PorP/SprF family membrane protein